MWNPIPGATTTLYANGPGDWDDVVNMPAGNTAVVAFMNTGVNYNGVMSSYRSLVSSFAENMHATSATVASAAYDIWFNHSGTMHEVMIHNDLANRGGCGTWAAKNVTFGGSNGVPVRSDWDLCVAGSAAFWQVPARDSFSSGSVDILAMVNWLIRHGYMPASTQLAAISYGFEVASTGGTDEDFQVSSLSITAS
jgi:hypothetical protein